MLADNATVANGKLFIHGGGWDLIGAAASPTIHPTMALALVFQVEHSEALSDIPITVDLVDDDEQPVGVHADGTLNVGHPAGMKPGSALFVPYAIQLPPLQLNAPMTYRFKVQSGERELASVPFRVTLAGPGAH